jgi:DME family drug/metabolite transporter
MLPVVVVLLAAVCFGTTGTAQTFAPAGADPVSIGAARILIGGGLLALVALISHLGTARRRRRRCVEARTSGSIPAGGPEVRPPAGGARRRVPSVLLVLIGAAGVLAYQPLFFAGTAANGVAVGTVVALGSAPVITGALDAALTRRRPRGRWVLATLVAMVGVVLISGVATPAVSEGALGISGPGLLASVGAGASYAVYTLASKALLDRGWSATSTMGALFGVAAAASLPVLLAAGASWLATPAGLAMALWLGGVTTAVAYLFFGWGLARLPAATVSTLTLAEPLTATLLGTLLLGEVLPPAAVVGLAVLGAGLIVLALPSRTRRAPSRAPSRLPSRAPSRLPSRADAGVRRRAPDAPAPDAAATDAPATDAPATVQAPDPEAAEQAPPPSGASR